MPTFIDMSALTKRTTLTGNEEFQVSATEKVTAQQIADLATRGLSIITVTNFNTRTWTGGKSASEMVEGEIQAFISAANTTGAPSNSAYRGFVQKVSGNSTSYVLRYYAWSADVSVTGIYIGFSMYIGNCSWKSLTFDQSRKTVIEVGDFTTINELWPASVKQTPGNVVSFYTGTNVYSQPEASETKYVGFVILDTDFANTKTATVIAYGQNTGKQYIGKLEYEAQSIDWYPLTYASRLTNAVKVTAFTESSLSSLLSSWKTGDVVPFTTNSVTASTANQFPASGIFNGFISMGSNEGDYFQIFAFKSGSTKAYLGACIGSTTQWTALEGGGTAEPIVVADAESVATVVAAAFPKFEYGKMLPIYIDPGSDIYDCISITASHITVEESTVCGYAQCVYDGGDYYYIGVDLSVYPGGGIVPLYRAQMVINNSGDVVDSSTFPLGMYTAPIPGYTKVNGDYIDCSLVNGSTTVASLTQSVPANTTCFIEADVQTSVTGGTVKTSSALMFFRLAPGGTMCDINSRALGGTNQGQVKLNVGTINSQKSFVIVTTAYSLASNVLGGIIRIKNIYAKL